MLQSLEQTRYELNQLPSDEDSGFGVHLGTELAVGRTGIQVGEIPFDPYRHKVEDIDPSSMYYAMTGHPHVPLVVPFRPLKFNVVLHSDTSEGEGRVLPSYMEPIQEHRTELAFVIKDALDEIAIHGDEAEMTVVGDLTPFEDNYGINKKEDTEDPDEAAREIGRIINSRKVTLVVSRFDDIIEGLEEYVAGPIGLRAIAVKANHEADMRVPSNRGEYLMDNGRTLDTDDPRAVSAENERIAGEHSKLVKRLEDLGLIVAQVVYGTEFDIEAADESISQAVNELSSR